MKFIAPVTALVLLFSACNNGSDKPVTDPDIAVAPVAAPANIPYTIIAQYPHDRGAYTQGLELHNGKMYEGTGDWAKSALRITNHKTGAVEINHPIGSDKIFGEGITIFKDKIYQLTWQSNIVYVYDIKDITKPIKTFEWPYEGWGITHNATDLIISTGVNPNLYFVNPDNFQVKNILPITDNKGPVLNLNELEFINGFVYANIWETNNIVKIDPETGKVVGNMDFTGVIKQYAPDYTPIDGDEVLNGIAYDSASKTMFVTGKRWPKMFELKLN
ncbi:glutaminyl-peptide cyclotransferase [Ferruginibacter sp. HRS2-29]|uniref:glutaminyl-peptide cyclotransferase n=1 Tax=Ferruginibacter sp. HRS2-29 TaxID=2487334 RepID=UPI0020CEA9A0|nr:glutaminyl-peptide cyclotransferase [Ferruginibacter sp. HRS2-29]MCP9751389.1 glutaminyl-peptide cyclotransferase [Ferruginibacter sp. HRS2-29]